MAVQETTKILQNIAIALLVSKWKYEDAMYLRGMRLEGSELELS